MATGRGCCLMEKYVEIVKEYLGLKRNIGRKIFYLMGRVYRGVNNNRFTCEEAEEKLFGKRL